MAGTVVQTRTWNAGSSKEKFERIINLSCTSDAAAGTIPDETVAGLGGFQIDEVITTPGGTPPTTQYRVYITDADGGVLYLSSSARSLSAKERESGHAGDATYSTGNFPRIDGTMTVRIAATGALTAANVGNSKLLEVELRCTRRTA